MAEKLGPHLPMTAMRSLMISSVNTISCMSLCCACVLPVR